MSLIKKGLVSSFGRESVSRGVAISQNFFSGQLRNDVKQLEADRDFFANFKTLEELPFDDTYYIKRYGIDKVSFFAFLRADRFAYDACYRLEEAQYATTDYSPFYP